MHYEQTYQHMKKGLTLVIILITLLIGTSCATTRRSSVKDQRRGLLMLEGDNIYKNKGFYKNKKSSKQRKKNIKMTQRNPRRSL